jgi:hypothetical protein
MLRKIVKDIRLENIDGITRITPAEVVNFRLTRRLLKSGRLLKKSKRWLPPMAFKRCIPISRRTNLMLLMDGPKQIHTIAFF